MLCKPSGFLRQHLLKKHSLDARKEGIYKLPSCGNQTLCALLLLQQLLQPFMVMSLLVYMLLPLHLLLRLLLCCLLQLHIELQGLLQLLLQLRQVKAAVVTAPVQVTGPHIAPLLDKLKGSTQQAFEAPPYNRHCSSTSQTAVAAGVTAQLPGGNKDMTVCHHASKRAGTVNLVL